MLPMVQRWHSFIDSVSINGVACGQPSHPYQVNAWPRRPKNRPSRSSTTKAGCSPQGHQSTKHSQKPMSLASGATACVLRMKAQVWGAMLSSSMASPSALRGKLMLPADFDVIHFDLSLTIGSMVGVGNLNVHGALIPQDNVQHCDLHFQLLVSS